MPTYAQGTSVLSENSRAEIERTVHRFGASDFAYATRGPSAVVGFVIQDRQVRFVLTLPDRQAREFTHHSRGARTASAAEAEYDKAVREHWRALALLVKAKLAAVESNITTVEEEFLGHIILPNARSVYDNVREGVEHAYVTGKVPPMLELGS